jgi:hypothetical protein
MRDEQAAQSRLCVSCGAGSTASPFAVSWKLETNGPDPTTEKAGKTPAFSTL